jgi:predicted metal-dependent phosphoesterase TrpH
MPAGQPFTLLCQQAARGRFVGRADLHLHTTCSDGVYTPAQLVELGCRAGLAALAVTDHDTLTGVAPASAAAAGKSIEIVPGVEITCTFRERELHLLAYFFDAANRPLQDALARLRHSRVERFQEMVLRLRKAGVELLQAATSPDALGRRYLAECLCRAGCVGSIREAFARYLHDGSAIVVPKERLPVAEALVLVRGAGGAASWAHPGKGGDRAALAKLRALGLAAVEVDYPDVPQSRQRQLRTWAAELGLAVTGGSDCHGPGRREVGCCSIAAGDLDALRRWATDSPLTSAPRLS